MSPKGPQKHPKEFDVGPMEKRLELARRVLVTQDARKDENIDEWAERLATQVSKLTD